MALKSQEKQLEPSLAEGGTHLYAIGSALVQCNPQARLNGQGYLQTWAATNSRLRKMDEFFWNDSAFLWFQVPRLRDRNGPPNSTPAESRVLGVLLNPEKPVSTPAP